MFNREIEAAEAWMGAREAFLASDDVGGSLDGIEALIKKHEDFDKSLNAQVTYLKGKQVSYSGNTKRNFYKIRGFDILRPQTRCVPPL